MEKLLNPRSAEIASPQGVIAGLVPAISIRRHLGFIIGMAGTSPAMTV